MDKKMFIGYWNRNYYFNNTADYKKACSFHQMYFSTYERIFTTRLKTLIDFKQVSYLCDVIYKDALKNLADTKWQEQDSFEQLKNMLKRHRKQTVKFLGYLKKDILKKQKTVG